MRKSRQLYGTALGTLFFFSGVLGLVYEIVWFRRLHLTLGVSIFAVGAVVSAFMLGLAVGSRWAAQSAWLRRSPLTVFAGLELGIGVYAVAFPLLVAGLEGLYPALFRLLETQAFALTLTRFFLAFALLLPPTFLMGASLPTVAEAAVAPPGHRARRVAGLYALNTAGAVLGTLVAGFVLIEHLGITRSLHLGAAGSALLAASAFFLARLPVHRGRPSEPVSDDCVRSPEGPPDEAAPLATTHLAVTAAAVAGAASLASELVWTRALVFFVHNSTYAFSAILAVYLLGIALGALLATRFVRTAGTAVRALAGALAAGSSSLLLGIGVYRHLPGLAGLLVGERPLDPGVSGVPDASLLVWSWGSALLVIFGQVAAVLFLPALFLGAVFPLTLKLVDAEKRSAAELVGRLFAVNTLGSVVGAVAGTFALVALLGTRGALLFVAWLPVPVALWALWRATSSRRARGVFLASLVLAVMTVGSLAAAPAGFYRELFAQRFGPVVWFSEGVSETVAVCDHEDGSRWIQFSDGRGASGTLSHQGGWLISHLPLLLHPDPESAAVVCFGTGNTLGAASRHPLKVIDGIELSPEVVKAAPLFAETNHDVLDDQRVRVIIEDGRSYFLASDRGYDVIATEPPLVHTAGVVNLYSRDFYELSARSLTDDGLVAVWLATWELEAPELQMLVRAFVDVFPWASVWDCTHDYEWLLIGSKKAPALDLDALETRMADPLLARDLARIDPEMGGIRTPADLLSLYLMGRDAMVAFANGADPVTDDHSVVDFTTPRRARANFGLGEWVTGGIRTFGVGPGGLTSTLRLRPFDRVYALRESPESLVGDYGRRDPAAFRAEVRGPAWARELRATRLTLEALRRMAMDHLAMGRPERGLEALDRGLRLVPAEATGPIHTMRAEVLQMMGRSEETGEAKAEAARANDALRARTARGGFAATDTEVGGR